MGNDRQRPQAAVTGTKRLLWRYHFRDPVRSVRYVDHPEKPEVWHLDRFLVFNIPSRQSRQSQVYIPWSNIKYVEMVLEGDPDDDE